MAYVTESNKSLLSGREIAAIRLVNLDFICPTKEKKKIGLNKPSLD